jgi:hypothetical protein
MDAEDLIGRTGAPFRMVIEEGKVREFAAATGSSHPEHLTGPTPISPVTFLASARLWQDERNLPWNDVDRDQARVLHGGQEFVFHGPPPRAGTELVGQMRIEDVFEKTGRRGGTMVFTKLVTEFRTTNGELVAVMRSTAIETSRPAVRS